MSEYTYANMDIYMCMHTCIRTYIYVHRYASMRLCAVFDAWAPGPSHLLPALVFGYILAIFLFSWRAFAVEKGASGRGRWLPKGGLFSPRAPL